MTAAKKVSFTEGLAYWQDNFPQFADACLQIRTKEGAVETFKLNKAQRYIHDCLEKQRAETGKVRAIILKGRQQGCSTYIEGRFYWRSIFRSGVRTFILAHEKDSTSAIYEMAKRYHENNPIAPSTGTSNSRELVFDGLDSGYRIGTAGNESVGRGTTIQYFHGSEVAFWPRRSEGEITKGIFQAVPDMDETELILESTANGTGNFFHSETMKALRGDGEYQLIFIPWFWTDEYQKPVPPDFVRTEEEDEYAKLYKVSDNQLAWRRNKIVELSTAMIDGLKAFKQEYPFDIHEAFQNSGEAGFIKPELVQAARKHTVAPSRLLIVGVDPSRGGDRFSIARRSGRKVYDLESHVGDLDLAAAIQILKPILDNERPAMMFVDAGGGDYIVDRLWELGYKNVRAIHFGGSPLNKEKYKNRRAEMWGEMAEWLDPSVSNLEVDIPDSDSLQMDLCSPQITRDTQDRYVLESKDSIRKRGMPSPDEGDAIALTFAEPVSERTVQGNFRIKRQLG
jgi:hypothetical protein